MVDQNGSRNRADTAGYRGDRLNERFHFFVIDITAEFLLLFAVLNTDIDDDLFRMSEGLVDHLRPSGRANQDIGFGCNGRKILGSGVTDGDGRIPLHQQKRYRTANHQRTAQDDDVLTFHIDLVMIQDLQDRLGSAGRKAQVPTGKDAG